VPVPTSPPGEPKPTQPPPQPTPQPTAPISPLSTPAL
jgi:hypothetical protein